MSEIESKLGRMSFESTETKMFEIPDESGYHENMEESYQPQPQVRKISAEEANKHRAEMMKLNAQVNKEQTSSAKTRIELLVGIGRGLTTVEVDGVEFQLRTLKGRDPISRDCQQ